jgi:regulator of replication initiation timing
MNYLKTVRMDDHTILIGLISALGLKEIWNIWKKKIDLNAAKEEREENIYAKQVDILTNKISQLETKIELLIEENIQLRVKIERMQTRLVVSAKKKVNRKNNEKG